MLRRLLIALLIVGCDSSTEATDCAGVAGGTAVVDVCGVCNGDGLDGYNCGDLDVLQHIIDENLTSYIESMDDNGNSKIEPLELGEQIWEDGHLISFDCMDLDIYDSFGVLLISYKCRLSGGLTESIGHFSKIENLNLSHNNLTGQLPATIYNLSSLTRLFLSNNYFVGEIPNQICDLNLSWGFDIEDGEYSSIDQTDISNNKFCPSYPDCGDGEITSTNEQDTSNCNN